MSKVKTEQFQPKLINAAIVAGIQAVYGAQEQANNSASDVAESLHELGFRPEHILQGTDAKPNAAFKRDLWLELVESVITAPTFGNLNRDAVRAKLDGKKAPNADAATIRRLAMGKVNAAISLIRTKLAQVDSETGKVKKTAPSLHEQLDGFAHDALELIKAKCDKAGLTQEQVSNLQAAWRTCRASTNSVFKGK